MIEKLDLQFDNVRQGTSEHALAEGIMMVARKLNEVIDELNKRPE